MKAFVLALIASSVCHADVLSVCDLLARMPAHDGETIQVRGFYGAWEEGSFIGDDSCGAPISHHDQKWEAGVWLAFPNAPNKPRKEEFDFDAFDRLVKAHREAVQTSSRAIATFTGKLKYCPVLAKTRSGELKWIGCGFLGYYPLEIIVTSVSDIRTEKRQQ